MPTLLWIITFSLAGGILSLLGGVFLLWQKNLAQKFSGHLVSFAIGALLSVAFFDLIPEAYHEAGGEISILNFVIFGILLFFLIEKFFIWRHCHHQQCEMHIHKPTTTGSYKYILIIGDTIHNFIDGIIIALSFMVSFPLGLVTSLAVILHEIPQEIADFGVLIHSGMKRIKILIYNILSALASLVGAIAAYFAFSYLENAISYLIAVTAGNFIYIALSDLIPEIHKEFRLSKTFWQVLFLGTGVLIVWWLGKVIGE